MPAPRTASQPHVSAEQQAATTAQLYKAKLSAGERWYLVDAAWIRDFQRFTGFNLILGKAEAPSSDARPGPVDNSRLQRAADNPWELRRDLEEHRDYEFVPEELWNAFMDWYGGGPAFPRLVITVGLKMTTRIELHPIVLRYCWADENGAPTPGVEVALLASKDTIASFAKSISGDEKSEGEDVKVRVWMPETKSKEGEGAGAPPAAASAGEGGEGGEGGEKADAKREPAGPEWTLVQGDSLTTPLSQFELPSNLVFLAERRRADGTWARGATTNWRDFAVGQKIDAKDTVNKWLPAIVRMVKGDKILVHYVDWDEKWDDWFPTDSPRLAAKGTYTSGSNSVALYRRRDYNEPGTPEERGVVGLRNLGNTCFMNSTLQCLFNTPLLTDYILEDKYMEHINRVNPLGCKGRIADEYGALVKEMWSGNYTVVAPSSFKEALGEFQPRFAGYEQQDSQELLQWLTDGLHEDLNRVVKKPATQTPEHDGRRSDAEVADEAWKVHQMRNQSIVVDIMQGQLRSRLVCPHCNRVSITFDPFSFLSVPLPGSNIHIKRQKVAFVPATTDAEDAGVSGARLIHLELNKAWNVIDLKKALQAHITCELNNMVVCDVWSSRVYKTLDDKYAVDDIMTSSYLYVYEVPNFDASKIKPKAYSYSAYSVGPAPAPAAEPEAKEAEPTLIQVVHQRTRPNPYFGKYPNERELEVEAFGIPFLVAVQPNATTAEVLAQVRENARRFHKPTAESPFKVFLLDNYGRSCYKCAYSDHCDGCAAPEGDLPFLQLVDKNQDAKGFSIGLRWNEPAEVLDVLAMDKLPVVGSIKEPEARAEKKAVALNDCLHAFSAEEVLTEENPYFCRQCKDHRLARKKFDLWKLPSILVIHLKRFYFARMTGYREKIDTLIDFPIRGLDLKQFCLNPDEMQTPDGSTYDLYAVSYHESFGSMDAGHYTAAARNLLNGRWYKFNDSSVSPMDESQIVTDTAYVLYYQRRSTCGATEYVPHPAESRQRTANTAYSYYNRAGEP